MSLPSPQLNAKGQTVADATGNEVTEYFQASDSPEQKKMNTQDKDQKNSEVPFKERVIGVAQKTRGTVLGNQDLKRHGAEILEGKASHEKDRLQ